MEIARGNFITKAPLPKPSVSEERPAPGRLRELLFSPRTPHLLRLWDELRALPALPQLDRWLGQRFRLEKRFGQKDRKWYSDALFGVFRLGLWTLAAEQEWQAQADETLEKRAQAFAALEPQAYWPLLRALPGPRLFLWLGLRLDRPQLTHTRFPEARILEEWEEQLLSLPPALQLLWHGVPSYFLAHWQERSWTGAAAQLFLERQSVRPPLWLRLNRAGEAAASELLSELTAKGFTAQLDGLAASVQGELGIYQLEAYKKGLIEVQDRASQRIGEAVPLKRGAVLWDCCAGGGGKTVQLAARLQNSGAVYASDVRAYKLDDLRERAGRAQLANVRYWDWDGKELPPFGKELQRRGGFDAVLIDAPCSATGTWRRNPDAKLRVSQASLDELVRIQDGLLSLAAKALRPGGSLVYATCSWLRLENEARIDHFLAQHSAFTLKEARLLGCPDEDADSMFVAVLEHSPQGAAGEG